MFELLFLADRIYPFHLFRATTLKQFLEEKLELQLLTTDVLLTLISKLYLLMKTRVGWAS